MEELLYTWKKILEKSVLIYIKQYYMQEESDYMSNGYYEYRLHEINEILDSGIENVNPEIAELLQNERKQILHELRHTESLPTDIL